MLFGIKKVGVFLDVDFIFDRKSNRYSVVLEGEFVAISRFISTELDGDLLILQQFVDWLVSASQGSKTYTEWTVEIDGEDVEVISNHLLEHDDQQETEEESLLDWESRCACGKDDLIKVLRAYIRFKQ
ncbi:MAG: YacL family protein [Gammaproteobacteria bacterium]|nr:YacL family protein [Gammaproteobacteria bacterium]